MKVLDTSFLIDYESGIEETKKYLLDNENEQFIIPSVVYMEFLLGEVHSSGKTNLNKVKKDLEWAKIYPISEKTAKEAAKTADKIGNQGPDLKAVDAIVAGVAREIGATVVSSDSHHTHEETKKIIDVDEYL